MRPSATTTTATAMPLLIVIPPYGSAGADAADVGIVRGQTAKVETSSPVRRLNRRGGSGVYTDDGRPTRPGTIAAISGPVWPSPAVASFTRRGGGGAGGVARHGRDRST